MVPEENETPVASGIDKTPTLKQQAEKRGWEAGVFSFGKAEDDNVAFFNPGLVERDDGLWLMVRRARFQHALDFGYNDIWACQLLDDMTPHGGKILTFPNTAESNQQFEDARCIKVGSKVLVSCCNFIWYGDGSWTGAHQVLAEFQINYDNPDEDWVGLHRFDLEIDGNGRSVHERTKHQKNWTFFTHDNKLHLHFSTFPWVIAEFSEKSLSDITPHRNENGVQWKYGHMRGGTPPVRVGDLYWTFNHSSLPWTGRYRKYFMGAVAFEAKPPFKPVFYTQQPILEGSQNDAWANRKPLVVFPGGAVCKDGVWTIVYGINDLKSGWMKMSHEDLVKLSIPVPERYPPMLELEETHKSQDGRTLDEPKTEKTDEEERFDVKPRDPQLVDIAVREVQSLLHSEEIKSQILKAIIASPILNGQSILANGHGTQQTDSLRGGQESPKPVRQSPSSDPVSVYVSGKSLPGLTIKERRQAQAAKARAALAEKRKLQKNLRVK